MKRLFFLSLIAISCLPALWYLLQPGFFVTDDGDWMVIRFSAFHQELADGQVPVRWLNRLNNGYGYPVATFLYPGFMYAAEIPHALGLGFVWSVKSVMIVSVVAGFAGIYFWLSNRFSRSGSLFGAYSFIYHPYLLYDIYTRGSVGEVMALGIVPSALWAVATKRYVLLSFLYGMLIVAHNTLALLFVPLLFIYHIICLKRYVWKEIKVCLAPLIAGISLASFFWIPAVFELHNTMFSRITVSDWKQYFITPGIFSRAGYAGGALFLVWMCLLLLRNKHVSRHEIFFGIVYGAGVVLAVPLSWWVWNTVPLGTFVQFPFRFLSYAVIATPFIAAFTADLLVKNSSMRGAFLGVGICVFIAFSFPSFIPGELTMRDESYYTTNEATTTVQNEYMPTWVGTVPEEHVPEQVTRISPDVVQINTIFWPGFFATVNGVEHPVSVHDSGLMTVAVPDENARVEIGFRETPLRSFADAISMVSVAVLVFWLHRRRGL